jgi:DNA polymerase-4
MQIVKTQWRIGEKAPIRALTAGVTHLVPADKATEQLNLFDFADSSAAEKREKQERLEAAMDRIRQKHGSGSVTMGFAENEAIGILRPQKERRAGDEET